MFHFEAADTSEERLDKIDGYLAQYGFSLPDYAPVLADLLSVPFEPRYSKLELPPDRRRQRLIAALVRIIALRAEQQPTLLVVEDLQWADASTLDGLTELLEHMSTVPLLAIFSYRSEFAPPWTDSPGVERLLLNRLSRDASLHMVKDIAGKPLPDELLVKLLDEAGGVPLYLEECTKLVLEMGLLRQTNGHFDLSGPVALAIPSTLADSLMARLDRLASAKGVAQIGATIGRQFSFELLMAVLRDMNETVDAPAVERDLTRLVDSELVFAGQSGTGTDFTFKHALIQDAAYLSLMRSTRQQYHQHIAQVLVRDFSATPQAAPEVLAHHYTHAGLAAEAVPCWLEAGRHALRASANLEAIAQLKSGLDLLTSLPATPDRAARELEFRLTLGPAYMATSGYAAPEVEACYDRARELCRELGDTPQLAPVLHGLWTYHIVRAQHRTAFELARQVLHMGVATNDDGLMMQGNMDCGWSHFFQGSLVQARQHLEPVLALYDHERHASQMFTYGDNPAASAGGCLAQTLWLLGYPDEALSRSEETIAFLRRLNHPYSLAFGLDLAGFVRQYRGDPPATRTSVEEAIEISLAQGMTFSFIAAMGAILRGWVMTQDGELEEGITQMRHGLESQVATGAELAKPFWYCLQAEANWRAGDVSSGLALLQRAEEAVERTNERYWESEIYRLRGQLLSDVPISSEGESSASPPPEHWFGRALEVARGQGARSLELRAAVALARRWLREGRELEARELLVPVYESFTEGLETPDLGDATTLLGELGVPTANPVLSGDR